MGKPLGLVGWVVGRAWAGGGGRSGKKVDEEIKECMKREDAKAAKAKAAKRRRDEGVSRVEKNPTLEELLSSLPRKNVFVEPGVEMEIPGQVRKVESRSMASLYCVSSLANVGRRTAWAATLGGGVILEASGTWNGPITAVAFHAALGRKREVFFHTASVGSQLNRLGRDMASKAPPPSWKFLDTEEEWLERKIMFIRGRRGAICLAVSEDAAYRDHLVGLLKARFPTTGSGQHHVFSVELALGFITSKDPSRTSMLMY